MTIRELFSCVDTECCTRMRIRCNNHDPINLYVDWSYNQDPDFKVFDRLADILRVDNWYISADGVAKIRSYDKIDTCTAEFIREVL